MDAFTGVKSYFKQVFQKSLKDGYITFNDVTNRKSFFDFLDYFNELQGKMDKMDWNVYRQEKYANTDYYINELGPTVKEYFKLRGIIERRSYNYRVQGSSADITKEALILLFNYIVENNYFKKVLIPNVVHDEILVECPKELEEEFKSKVVECMELAGSKYFTRVKLGASCDAGDHWIH